MRILKTLLLSAGALGLLIACLLGLALYVGTDGVPFIEGDEIVTEGSAFGFSIGSSKSQVLSGIQKKYNKEKYYVRILWPREAIYADELKRYENTEWKNYESTKFSEYKVEVNELERMELPLILSSRWDIDMPAEWVNTIYLNFANDRLVEIRKSRWLFERP